MQNQDLRANSVFFELLNVYGSPADGLFSEKH
jgi:hypothetical protein